MLRGKIQQDTAVRGKGPQDMEGGEVNLFALSSACQYTTPYPGRPRMRDRFSSGIDPAPFPVIAPHPKGVYHTGDRCPTH